MTLADGGTVLGSFCSKECNNTWFTNVKENHLQNEAHYLTRTTEIKITTFPDLEMNFGSVFTVCCSLQATPYAANIVTATCTIPATGMLAQLTQTSSTTVSRR